MAEVALIEVPWALLFALTFMPVLFGAFAHTAPFFLFVAFCAIFAVLRAHGSRTPIATEVAHPFVEAPNCQFLPVQDHELILIDADEF
jgi:hypothetical protein